MELCIHVHRSETGDIVTILALSLTDGQLVSVTYLGQRFGLDPNVIKNVCVGGKDPTDPPSLVSSRKISWDLKVGSIYFLNTVGTEENVCKIEDDTDVEIVDFDLPINHPESILSVEGKSNPIYHIPAFDILWKVKGRSEISKFVARFLVSGREVEAVECLPK